jgi:hypothetical protein
VDYRKLNDVTRKDCFPLPRIDDTLDTLAGAKWFSTLDLKRGYWQVDLLLDDKENTAFPLLGSRLGSDHIENMSRGVCLATVVNTCHIAYSMHVTISFTTLN